jgi:two-component system, cell cycle sensor histidine kinase and response regulator CckA
LKSILTVDDEPALLALLVALLRIKGHHPIEAPSGEAALEIIKKDTAIDGLVTDILMPGMNGFALAQEFRILHPVAPILFISGYFDCSQLEYLHWLKLPKVALLQKPFDPAVFLENFESLFLS